MGMYCFGIDVGGTSVKCGLFLTNGTLVEQWEIPTRLENNGSSILPDVADAIKTKLDERGITKDNVDGVGIGIPGPVNENGEVPMAVNLHWGFKAVASELSALTGLPAKAANDANIAALGEAWKGAAEGAKNVILVTLGTGVGTMKFAHVTAVITDVWSSMHLQPELYVWQMTFWRRARRTARCVM